MFDPSEQRMCVRVVYDGAAGAGKTTNVRRLASLFAAQRMSEVASPAELRGRTVYFDWLQIAAGAICGYPLICQVVSVPGQVAFNERRRHLLASADVVVFVCDSSRRELDAAREALLLADDLILPSGEPIPVVIQANKQDRADAVDGKTLLATTGRRDIDVVEAIAADGIGVVDTFVSAVRTASRAIQARMDRETLRVPVRRAEDDGELLARLSAVPIDRAGAAELVLEEAAAALSTLAADVGGPVDLGRELVAAEQRAASPARASEADVAERARRVASLPRADVPTGFVWPAHTGRALLRALALEGELPVAPDGAVHVAGDHVVTTSPPLRFTDQDHARHALVRAARERTQLESLHLTDTVLVVQPAADGSCWLWTVRPRIELASAWLASDPRARIAPVAAALADAAALTFQHRIAFTPGLGGFGAQGDAVRYFGALASTNDPAGAARALLFDALEQVVGGELDAALFVEPVVARLELRLDREHLAAIARECTFDATGAGGGHEVLVRALARMSEAA
ncbi:MAG: GTPase domain-containing protein [Labilithrix sp.]|nr:GTPase domain-containing protein [Labilithrix sp.]